MPPHKRLCASVEVVHPPEDEDMLIRKLPDDLLPEIFRWMDIETLIRCASCCKRLRRAILGLDIRRVCHEPGSILPAFIFGFLNMYNKESGKPKLPKPFSLVLPATRAAVSFSEKHIVPHLSKSTGEYFMGHYMPLTSRHGLVVLCRRYIPCKNHITVYDPVTGDRTFLPQPPDLNNNICNNIYVLLTAADGVGCRFLLLAAKFCNLGTSGFISVQTISSDDMDRKWGHVTTTALPRPLTTSSWEPCWSPVVRGTLIYWLMCSSSQGYLIFTYDVGTTSVGSIDLPPDDDLPGDIQQNNLHLAFSPDGRLRLLVSDQLTVSIWLRLSTGTGWERETVINTETLVYPMFQDLPQDQQPEELLFIESNGVNGIVLLQPTLKGFFMWDYDGHGKLVLLDLETKETQRVIHDTMYCLYTHPFEVDLASRLSTMKKFD